MGGRARGALAALLDSVVRAADGPRQKAGQRGAVRVTRPRARTRRPATVTTLAVRGSRTGYVLRRLGPALLLLVARDAAHERAHDLALVGVGDEEPLLLGVADEGHLHQHRGHGGAHAARGTAPASRRGPGCPSPRPAPPGCGRRAPRTPRGARPGPCPTVSGPGRRRRARSAGGEAPALQAAPSAGSRRRSPGRRGSRPRCPWRPGRGWRWRGSETNRSAL